MFSWQKENLECSFLLNQTCKDENVIESFVLLTFYSSLTVIWLLSDKLLICSLLRKNKKREIKLQT